MPWTIKEGSLVVGLICMALVCFLNIMSLYFLAVCCELTGKFTYKGIAELVFGRRYRYASPHHPRPHPHTSAHTSAHKAHTRNPHPPTRIHYTLHTRAHTQPHCKCTTTHTPLSARCFCHTPHPHDTTRHTHTHAHFSLFFQTIVGLYTVGTCISLLVLTADFLGEDKVRVYSCSVLARM